MRRILFPLLLTLLGSVAFAQSSIKVYRIGDQVGVRSAQAKGTYASSDVSVFAIGGAIGVRVAGYTNTYTLPNFQNAAGTPYGSTIDGALSAYESAVSSVVSGTSGSSSTAAFGTATPTVTEYDSYSATVPMSNVVEVTVQVIGSSNAGVGFTGGDYYILDSSQEPLRQKTFRPTIDPTTNKLFPLADMVVGGHVRVTRYYKQ